MDWDDYADTWDEGEPQRVYAKAAFQTLADLSADAGVALQGARICDFGCGTGLLTEHLAPLASAIVGVDISAGMRAVLDAKIARHGWSHVTTTAAPPTVSSTDAFDLVVCSSVCAFLDDYPAMVARLAALLRPGGLFVQWDWELDPTDEEPYGLTRQQITSALEAAELEILRVDTGFSVPFGEMTMSPLMAAGRRPA